MRSRFVFWFVILTIRIVQCTRRPMSIFWKVLSHTFKTYFSWKFFFGMYQIDMSSESIFLKKNICKRISASTFITALHQTHIHWSQIQHLDWLHFSHIYLIDLAYLFNPNMHAETVCWFMFVLYFFFNIIFDFGFTIPVSIECLKNISISMSRRVVQRSL